MFHPRMFWNSRADGFPVLEILPETGDDLMPSRRSFVPLKKSRLSGTVTGPLAALTLTQTFGYSRAECPKNLEALYRFPLPGDAAVTGVVVRFGDVEIRATLKEREEAEAEYEEAKAQGKQAALTTRESPDVFTLRVAGIRPDEEIVVETAYVQLAREEADGSQSLRVPLTTAPRYTRSDENGSRHADGQPLAVLRDPGHRFALDLRITEATAVQSPTHQLALAEDSRDVQIRLTDGEVVPDRDLVLTWRARAEGDKPALRVYTHAEPNGADAPLYFLAEVAPPAGKTVETLPREVILLVDHSGSMEGAKWAASDWAVTRFLSSLTPQDTLAVGLFHNDTRWFSQRPEAADSRTVQKAIDFVKNTRDSGGTELGVALEQALHLPVSGDSGRGRHVLIITDAEVSDAGRILRLADEAAKAVPEKRRRISVLCIDAAPNSFLALELAERGNGIARFLTSAPDDEDITTALDTILEEWAAPVLVGMRLQVNRPGVSAAGRQTWQESDASEIDLGDLPAGHPRWVAGRIPGAASGGAAFALTAGFGTRARTVAEWQEEASRYEPRPGVKALFGARRVLALEHLLSGDYAGEDLKERLTRLGYDADAVLSAGDGSGRLYAENRREDAGKSLKRLLVREALEFGLASSETAFIAVRAEAGVKVEATAIVANALPSGWSEGFAGAAPPLLMAQAAPMMPAPVAPAMAPPPPGMAWPSARSMPSMPSGVRARKESKKADQAKSGGVGGFFRRLISGEAAPEPMDDAFADMAEEARESEALVDYRVAPKYSGKPDYTGDRFTIFDSRVAGNAASTMLTELKVAFPSGAPDPTALDAGLEIHIFMDDLAVPRARVRLRDLVQQGGTRPLNIRSGSSATILLVLVDPNGIWSGGRAPEIVVTLG